MRSILRFNLNSQVFYRFHNWFLSAFFQIEFHFVIIAFYEPHALQFLFDFFSKMITNKRKSAVYIIKVKDVVESSPFSGFLKLLMQIYV